MKTPQNQRWTNRIDSYRHADEPIDPSRYGVEVIYSDKLAKKFVVDHHYSASFPAARCRVGLYRSTPFRVPELVGVAVFSVPMSNAALQKHCGTTEAVELGRFVLLDSVPGNGETWFLARAFRILEEEKPEIRAVLSYSDPIPRQSADGRLVLPGHVGTIYQAFNGRHVGRSKAASHVLDRDGRVVSPRALSKLRNDTKGAGYAYELLRAAGAPSRRALESSRDYVSRALVEGPFRRLRHPGNLAYVWAVGDAKKRTRRSFPNPLQFVKAAA